MDFRVVMAMFIQFPQWHFSWASHPTCRKVLSEPRVERWKWSQLREILDPFGALETRMRKRVTYSSPLTRRTWCRRCRPWSWRRTGGRRGWWSGPGPGCSSRHTRTEGADSDDIVIITCVKCHLCWEFESDPLTSAAPGLTAAACPQADTAHTLSIWTQKNSAVLKWYFRQIFGELLYCIVHWNWAFLIRCSWE